MEDIKLAIVSTLEEIQPATVRQLYYQLVSRGAIEKTEAEYKTLVRLLTELRRAGRVPFSHITDTTRWMRKPRTYQGVDHLLASMAQAYRRDLWENQPEYCEIWLEKDALSGVLYSVTAENDIALMTTRGYPSVTFLNSAALDIAAIGKPTYIYYFGDCDPSGLDIPRKVEAGLREFAPEAEIHFERVAVTDEQIAEYQLPTRPTKKTDTRSRDFIGESVEVDALPPQVLRDICRACIERHIDQRQLEIIRTIEASERVSLADLAERGVA